MSNELAQAPPKGGRVAIPDPWDDPVGYLRHHKWQPEGDPRRITCRWLDPLKPRTARDEKLKVGERKLPDKSVQPVYQTHHTPAAWPMTRDEALAEQQRRDEEAKAKG